ncbi:hypothetical protein RJ55_05323 [Drechmeria coniospora]|nr:hypothetical protein RJ55_05323 [Drechmeria coniospora]
MGELADYLMQHDANFHKARLPALYSDFRSQRTLNPDGYRANVSAWRTALARLALRGRLSTPGSGSSLFVLSLDESLLRSLESRHYGQPLALGTAVREAVSAKHLFPLRQFLDSPGNLHRQGWLDLPTGLVGWTLRQLGIAASSPAEDTLPRGQFVVTENLETAAVELGRRTADKASRFDRVLAKSQFRDAYATSLVAGQRLSDTDMEVLLTFLRRDKKLIAYDGQTVRLRAAGEPEDITDEDTTIASIKHLTASLERQAALLNGRIDELSDDARNAVRRKNRLAALAALKSKKLAESSLAQRYATLGKLEEVAAKIEQASDQVQLVNIMKSSAGVLQALNAKVGDTDELEDVIDRLRRHTSDADQVASILAGSMGTTIDDTAVDERLLELELEERAEQAAQHREETSSKEQAMLESLPSVPAEALPDRTKVPTPTSDTGIASLSLAD